MTTKTELKLWKGFSYGVFAGGIVGLFFVGKPPILAIFIEVMCFVSGLVVQVIDDLLERGKDMKAEQEKHDGDGECVFCHRTTNHYSADPSQWPIWFSHYDGTGIVQCHCTECVTRRSLDRVDSVVVMYSDLNEPKEKKS